MQGAYQDIVLNMSNFNLFQESSSERVKLVRTGGDLKLSNVMVEILNGKYFYYSKQTSENIYTFLLPAVYMHSIPGVNLDLTWICVALSIISGRLTRY